MLYLRRTANTLTHETNQLTTQSTEISDGILLKTFFFPFDTSKRIAKFNGDAAVCDYKISKFKAAARNGYKTSFFITLLATIVYITISPLRYSRIKKSAE